MEKTKTTPATLSKTEAGLQGIIPGAEKRTIPTTRTKPKRPQTEELTELEKWADKKDGKNSQEDLF